MERAWGGFFQKNKDAEQGIAFTKEGHQFTITKGMVERCLRCEKQMRGSALQAPTSRLALSSLSADEGTAD
jgi:hypothetical protein